MVIMPEVSICCCLTSNYSKSTGKANSSAAPCHLQTCWFNSGGESKHLFVYAEGLTSHITESLIISNVKRSSLQTCPFLANCSFPFSRALNTSFYHHSGSTRTHLQFTEVIQSCLLCVPALSVLRRYQEMDHYTRRQA